MQFDIFESPSELEFAQTLIFDLQVDLVGRVARFRQLTDLSNLLGKLGTMIPGGETTETAWEEARTSFINGNYIATVMLCQGLAEHILAAYLELGLSADQLPKKVNFEVTLEKCLKQKVIDYNDYDKLKQLMDMRNPLSHYRNIKDPNNLTRRVLDTREAADELLFKDASFAIGVAVNLLGNKHFRID